MFFMQNDFARKSTLSVDQFAMCMYKACTGTSNRASSIFSYSNSAISVDFYGLIFNHSFTHFGCLRIEHFFAYGLSSLAHVQTSSLRHAHVIYRNSFGFKNENFHRKKNDSFLIFDQNIDCGYTLEPPRRGEAVLTSTHNLCFGAKIRKIGIPLQTPVFLYKSGV